MSSDTNKIHLKGGLEALSNRITSLTGTPGTGKSTLAGLLRERGLFVIEIEGFASTRGIYSYMENGETLVVEVANLVRLLEKFLLSRVEAIVVGHLSHNLTNPGAVVVLRTRPSILRQRLLGKGWPEPKVSENVEAEAMGIILGEAVELHGNKVSEIDTTQLPPSQVLDMFLQVHGLKRRYPPKARDWLLEHILKGPEG